MVLCLAHLTLQRLSKALPSTQPPEARMSSRKCLSPEVQDLAMQQEKNKQTKKPWTIPTPGIASEPGTTASYPFNSFQMFCDECFLLSRISQLKISTQKKLCHLGIQLAPCPSPACFIGKDSKDGVQGAQRPCSCCKAHPTPIPPHPLLIVSQCWTS